MSRREPLEIDISKAAECFRLFDKNTDGQISREEIGMMLRSMGQFPTEEDITAVIAPYDKNNSGVITFNEFVKAYADYKKDENALVDELEQAFKTLDTSNSGTIMKCVLTKVLCHYGMSKGDLEQMFKTANVDSDKEIKYEVFVKLWTQA